MQGRGETGDPRENPLTSGIVRGHNSHMRKSRSGPTGDRARFALVGGEQANHSATVAPLADCGKAFLGLCWLKTRRISGRLAGAVSGPQRPPAVISGALGLPGGVCLQALKTSFHFSQYTTGTAGGSYQALGSAARPGFHERTIYLIRDSLRLLGIHGTLPPAPRGVYTNRRQGLGGQLRGCLLHPYKLPYIHVDFKEEISTPRLRTHLRCGSNSISACGLRTRFRLGEEWANIQGRDNRFAPPAPIGHASKIAGVSTLQKIFSLREERYERQCLGGTSWKQIFGNASEKLGVTVNEACQVGGKTTYSPRQRGRGG
ncbi:hypothetical protein PR048_030794 [Dryococelus australis]|uniref:Uncharacterized protein n=1 Tax=Dryococelus australis TaxID=614101 RepID=A0ABQ9GAN5_9NEOP|nr:hypothetical protein PR048_030794 [Dryococelus australis]